MVVHERTICYIEDTEEWLEISIEMPQRVDSDVEDIKVRYGQY